MPPANTDKPTLVAVNDTPNVTNDTPLAVPTPAIPNATMQTKQSPQGGSSNGPISQLAAAAIASGKAAAVKTTSKPLTFPTKTSVQPQINISSVETQKEKEARQRAFKEASTEDEKRMRFLALLCGKNAFPQSITRERSNSIGRDRSNSLAGKDDHSNNVDEDTKQHPYQATSSANYTPTTHPNFSRRILHKSGVGYYDDAVSLLLSAAADRFLGAVLTQAKACRDRRLEGQKAFLGERRKRKRHRRRVLKERIEREKRFEEEVDKKRMDLENGMKESSGAKSSFGSNDVCSLKKEDLERLKEFRKENEDLDAEEDYYHSYFVHRDDERKIGENEDESDDDDSDEDMDEKQYDLMLRDIVRPLGAWGFDLSSKVRFDSLRNGMEEEEEYVQDKNEDEDGDPDDDAEDPDDADEDGDETDNDEGYSTKKKVTSPTKKKSPVKKDGPGKTATKKRKSEEDGETSAPATKKAAVDKRAVDEKPVAASKAVVKPSNDPQNPTVTSPSTKTDTTN